MATEIEKRKAKRLDCHVPIVSKRGTVFDTSRTVDISNGGVGFISAKFIPVNTKMAIEIALTPASESVLTVGQVKWVRQLPNPDYYRVGMVFAEISADSRSRLNQYFQK